MQITHNLLEVDTIKNKTNPLSLFIRKTAVITSVDEALVDLIIKDQWNNLYKQTREDSSVSEIEVSNIGKFIISNKKAFKKRDNILIINERLNNLLLKPSLTEKEKKKIDLMLLNNNNDLVQLKLKTKNEV